MHLVRLEGLTMLVNYITNIFLISLNIILYHVIFIKSLWISMLLVSKVLQSTEKLYTHPFNPVFFMLLAEKSPEIFPKCKRYFYILKSFALN